MKNICFLNSIEFWGGGEKLHLQNAIEFRKLNYRVTLLAKPKSPLWQKAHGANIPTYPIRIRNLSFLNPFKVIHLATRLYRLKIDTVVFSSSQDLKTGSLAAYLAGVQRVVYLRGLAVPIKNSLINRVIFKYFLTTIITNSEDTKTNILKHLGKYIAAEKIKTVYHGVDPNRVNRDPHGRLDSIQEKGRGVILGNAGRLTKQKEQEKLIEIAKILKEQGVDYTLFIAGCGERRSDLQQLIEKYDLQNHVFMLGFVSEMEKFMNSIDVFLLTSKWEGFGFVLVEAMIKSKPVVAFDISSNPEIIDHEKSGYLVDYPDLQLFAQKTAQLIQNSALRNRMGQHGSRIVHARFLLHDRIKEIENLLERTSNTLCI